MEGNNAYTYHYDETEKNGIKYWSLYTESASPLRFALTLAYDPVEKFRVASMVQKKQDMWKMPDPFDAEEEKRHPLSSVQRNLLDFKAVLNANIGSYNLDCIKKIDEHFGVQDYVYARQQQQAAQRAKAVDTVFFLKEGNENAHETAIFLVKEGKNTHRFSTVESAQLFVCLNQNLFSEDVAIYRADKEKKNLPEKELYNLSEIKEFYDADIAQALLDTDVKNISFTGVKFAGCSFKEASLSGAVFKNCEFDDCDLSSADMAGIFFKSCTIRNCNLNDARLYQSILDSCTVSSSDLTKTNLDLSSIQSCILSENTYDHTGLYNAMVTGSKITDPKNQKGTINDLLTQAAPGCCFYDTTFKTKAPLEIPVADPKKETLERGIQSSGPRIFMCKTELIKSKNIGSVPPMP